MGSSLEPILICQTVSEGVFSEVRLYGVIRGSRRNSADGMMTATSVAHTQKGETSVPEENKATVISDPEEVVSYWFPEDINNSDLATLRREAKRWMRGGPEVDREITERFG